jgi:hypothetical protein
VSSNDFLEIKNLAALIYGKGNDDDRKKIMSAIKSIEVKYHSA